MHLIDVHQNAVFEMGKNRRRARVTDNRCTSGNEILGVAKRIRMKVVEQNLHEVSVIMFCKVVRTFY